jgi:predicted RNA-binding protein YlxR (DUF448 family)
MDMAKAGNKQPGRQKHVPLRTCIACRETRPKRELLRVVRTPDGHVVLDPTGKKSGRGAYLCARLSCWQKALKPRKRSGRAGETSLLEEEFEVTLSEEDRAALEAYIATLPRDETPTPTQPASRKKHATEAASSQ